MEINLETEIIRAISDYIGDVKGMRFPSEAESFEMDESVLAELWQGKLS